MRLVEQIFSGWLECSVRTTGDGALLEPFDTSDDAARTFRKIVTQVIKHDGKGYSITSLLSSVPDGPASCIWIVCDDAERARQQEGVDELVDQILTLNLSTAGSMYQRKNRPKKCRRQNILSFHGREGDVEEFLLKQPIPIAGCNWPTDPSPAQAAAIRAAFGIDATTSQQAHTMLSAYEYARAVSTSFRFPAPRRVILTEAIAAFLLADRSLRDDVRHWTEDRWKEGSDIAVGIASQRPYKRAYSFALKVIDDMRGEGSEAFG